MEGNVYARGLMEACGVYLGSTIFCVLRSFPIYLVLCLDSYFVRLPERWLGITGLFLDLVFAWFTAGSHFRAATSWFWEAPGTLRQALGFSVYISAAVFWLRG